MAYRFYNTPTTLWSGVDAFSSGVTWSANTVAISCWVRTVGAVTDRSGLVWLLNDNGADGQWNWFSLYMIPSGSSNVVKWESFSDNTAYTMGTFSWSNTNYDWHHILATFNATDNTLKLSVDSASPQTKASSKGPITTPNRIYFSPPNVIFNAFNNGEIAEVAVYTFDFLYYGISEPLSRRVSPLNDFNYRYIIGYWDLNGWYGDRRYGRSMSLNSVSAPVAVDHCRIFN